MSARYEMAHAIDCLIEFVGSGAWLGDDQIEEGDIAVVLGDPWSSAFAITGTREELCDLASEILRNLKERQAVNTS